MATSLLSRTGTLIPPLSSYNSKATLPHKSKASTMTLMPGNPLLSSRQCEATCNPYPHDNGRRVSKARQVRIVSRPLVNSRNTHLRNRLWTDLICSREGIRLISLRAKVRRRAWVGRLDLVPLGIREIIIGRDLGVLNM